jgi:hypothetical protein
MWSDRSQHDVVAAPPSAVRDARAFFEGVAARIDGGDRAFGGAAQMSTVGVGWARCGC